jgi:hypothetical protein
MLDRLVCEEHLSQMTLLCCQAAAPAELIRPVEPAEEVASR